MTKYTSPLEDLNAGFAVDLSSCADARVPLKALFLCTDFPNCRAEDSPHPDPRYYFDILAGEGLRLFERMSYGRFRMTVTLHEDWVTLPGNDADYAMERVITWETHRRYIRDAFDAAGDVDFGAYDIVYIAAVEGSAVPYSPTMTAKSHPGEPWCCMVVSWLFWTGSRWWVKRLRCRTGSTGPMGVKRVS